MYTENYQKAKDFMQHSTMFSRSVAEEIFEMTGDNLTRFSNQMKKLSKIRKPEDFFNFQKECAQENLEALSKNAEKFMRLYSGRLEEWSKNCEACHTAVKNKMKETVDHALHVMHPHSAAMKSGEKGGQGSHIPSF